jgi:quercetin dioxygenase-like cupin family protein
MVPCRSRCFWSTIGRAPARCCTATPYPELFIVHGGEAEFEIDGARLRATAGDILIAHAGAAHRFTNTGDTQLRLTAIHTAPTMDTEWLQPSSTRGTPC